MRYNLYYLFREDQKKHPIDTAADHRILQALMALFRQKHPAKPPPKEDTHCKS